MIAALLAPYITQILAWLAVTGITVSGLFAIRQSGKNAERNKRLQRDNETLHETIRQDTIVHSGTNNDWMHDTRMDDAMRRKHDADAAIPKG